MPLDILLSVPLDDGNLTLRCAQNDFCVERLASTCFS